MELLLLGSVGIGYVTLMGLALRLKRQRDQYARLAVARQVELTRQREQLREALLRQETLVKASLEIGEVNNAVIDRNRALVAQCNRLVATNAVLRAKMREQREQGEPEGRVALFTGFSLN